VGRRGHYPVLKSLAEPRSAAFCFIVMLHTVQNINRVKCTSPVANFLYYVSARNCENQLIYVDVRERTEVAFLADTVPTVHEAEKCGTTRDRCVSMTVNSLWWLDAAVIVFGNAYKISGTDHKNGNNRKETRDSRTKTEMYLFQL